MMQQEQERLCRVQVWFDGTPLLDYRVERSSADRFAEAMRQLDTEVTIDDHVGDVVRPLPFAQLWQ